MLMRREDRTLNKKGKKRVERGEKELTGAQGRERQLHGGPGMPSISTSQCINDLYFEFICVISIQLILLGWFHIDYRFIFVHMYYFCVILWTISALVHSSGVLSPNLRAGLNIGDRTEELRILKNNEITLESLSICIHIQHSIHTE